MATQSDAAPIYFQARRPRHPAAVREPSCVHHADTGAPDSIAMPTQVTSRKTTARESRAVQVADQPASDRDRKIVDRLAVDAVAHFTNDREQAALIVRVLRRQQLLANRDGLRANSGRRVVMNDHHAAQGQTGGASNL